MPLRDHFHPPLASRRSWQGVHGGWPMVIVQNLNATLPERYVAEPQVHLGASIEVDIAAFKGTTPWNAGVGEDGPRGLAQPAWSPPSPSLAVATESPSLDEYAVRIYDLDAGRKLVAAVEIVSPANKDRPEHRRTFVNKCEVLLRDEVSVAIVDIVTSRSACLYDELLDQLGQHDSRETDAPIAYAVSVRWRPAGTQWRLESWAHRLNVGDPLPTLPLWLADDLAVPLDLETTYEQTCRSLRIP